MAGRWYQEAVIYCLDVETFQDSDGDGVGDFPGLTSRLDYLERLGVTCLWLHPIHPSPNRDDGYDVADFYNVDPRLGTLGDFVDFVHEAGARGLRVMIDLVVNHTSDEHPWFRSARSSPDSPFRDWYVWSAGEPRNLSQGVVFPGVQERTWTRDEEAGAWYFHARPQRRQREGAGGGRAHRRLLDPAGRGRVPHGRRPLRDRAHGARQRRPAQGLRLPPPAPGDHLLAAGRRHHPGRGQRRAGRAGRVLRAGRPPAHAVQLPPQPEGVPGAGPEPRRPRDRGGPGHPADPRHLPVVDVPPQPRRGRPGPAHRRGAPGGVRPVRPGREHAALRPGHPPPPGPHAGQRPAPAGDGLRPPVHPAGHARARLRRGAGHGRRPVAGGAQRHPDAHAVVGRSQRRLLHRPEREARPPPDRRGRLRLRGAERHQPAAGPAFAAWMERAIHTLRECPEFAVGDCTVLDSGTPSVLALRRSGPRGTMVALTNLADEPATVDLSAQLDGLPGPNAAAGEPVETFADGDYGGTHPDLAKLRLEGYGYRWIRLR